MTYKRGDLDLRKKAMRLIKNLSVIIIFLYVIAYFVINPGYFYKWGMQFFELGEVAYDAAEVRFKLAIIGERYIRFFTPHTELPMYYYWLGRSQANLSKNIEAKESLVEALELFEKYDSNNNELIALTNANLELICSQLNQDDEIIRYGLEAVEYYANAKDTQYAIAAASSYLWLAGAYYNSGDYINASINLEIGIPLYYDIIPWGVDDTHFTHVMAVMYKMAEISYEEIGDVEKSSFYKKQYADFVWLHDISWSDLQPIIDGCNWNIVYE